MIQRTHYLARLSEAVRRSPITALLGPRQAGKTTLAREFASDRESVRLDLESQPDRRRLENPELALGSLKGLVVLDEIQLMPELFAVLRVLVDRPDNRVRFLILGSASPNLIRNASESLAGRVEFIELSGLGLAEIGTGSMDTHWLRGGLPPSYLAETEEDSLAWREGYIRTFLERDIPQLGISIPAAALRRFWTMLAHYHGQILNYAELGRSMGVTDKTVRSYLDILTGTYMVQQLQPWHENLGKRQVKSPKIYLRDSGILHSLLSASSRHALLGHPKVGASWEGYALEQAQQVMGPVEIYFWGTYAGAELDAFFQQDGKRHGLEVKFSEAPPTTRSMRIALDDLRLDHLWVIYPGRQSYPVDERITVIPLDEFLEIQAR